MTKLPAGCQATQGDCLNNNSNSQFGCNAMAGDENCDTEKKMLSRFEGNDENANSKDFFSTDKTHNSNLVKRRMSICAACNQPIIDRYILRVQPNLEFHADCLVCSDCQRPLDESCTAFVRSGKTYCKEDYFKLFSSRCTRCHMQFERTDMVMRARNFVFHLNCFSCVSCERRLAPGEQYVIRSDELYCQPDCFRMPAASPSMRSVFFPGSEDNLPTSQAVLRQSWAAPPASQPLMSCINPSTNNQQVLNVSSPGLNLMMDSAVSPNPDNGAFGNTFDSNPFNPDQPLAFRSWNPVSQSQQDFHSLQQPDYPHIKTHSSLSSSVNSPADFSDNPDSVAAPSSTNSGCCAGGNGLSAGSSSTTGSTLTGKKSKKDKPAQRVRTVLNETQLKTLKQMYNINQRPDTAVKEHLVEKTGLSARVIRVWFQNKRCKDKKRQNALKEMQQSQEKEQALHGVRLSGIGPLVAGSPTSLSTEGCSSGHQQGSSQPSNLLNPIDIRQFPQNPALWELMAAEQQSAGGQLPPPPPYSHHQQQTAGQNAPTMMMQQMLSNSQPAAYGGAYSGLAASHHLLQQQSMDFASHSPSNDI